MNDYKNRIFTKLLPLLVTFCLIFFCFCNVLLFTKEKITRFLGPTNGCSITFREELSYLLPKRVHALDYIDFYAFINLLVS